MEDLCTEERTMNRILMGLHSSVSSHLCEYYSSLEKNKYHEKYPNVELYFEKVGNHQDRIKNLYFYYSFMLRAFNRANLFLKSYNYTTGNYKSDSLTKSTIHKILNISTGSCDSPFEEKEFMNSIKSVKKKI